MILPLITDRPAHYLHWWTNRKGWFAHSSDPIRETNGGMQWLARSVAFLCPTCGELWGRIECVAPPKYKRGPVEWHAIERACYEHGGGSFIDQQCTLPDPYVNLPGALVLYEGAVALEQYNAQS